MCREEREDEPCDVENLALVAIFNNNEVEVEVEHDVPVIIAEQQLGPSRVASTLSTVIKSLHCLWSNQVSSNECRNIHLIYLELVVSRLSDEENRHSSCHLDLRKNSPKRYKIKGRLYNYLIYRYSELNIFMISSILIISLFFPIISPILTPQIICLLEHQISMPRLQK